MEIKGFFNLKSSLMTSPALSALVQEQIFKRGLFRVLVYPPPLIQFVDFMRYVGIIMCNITRPDVLQNCGSTNYIKHT